MGYFVGPRGDAAPSGDSLEVGFLQAMIDHHDQAIRIALFQLGQGSPDGPWVFAQDVVLTQRYEIGVMEGWLQRWGHARGDLDRSTAMAWMGMASRPGSMPGMASAAELVAMSEAAGRRSDSMFFDLMIEHHEGGIHMAEHAAAHADDEEIRRLAHGMAENQRMEIAEMRQWRADRGM